MFLGEDSILVATPLLQTNVTVSRSLLSPRLATHCTEASSSGPYRYPRRSSKAIAREGASMKQPVCTPRKVGMMNARLMLGTDCLWLLRQGTR